MFYATIGLMGEQYGAPYNAFPYSMWEIGKSGCSEWGALCGSLLGALGVLAMFWGRQDRDEMTDDLFRWYETTAFPMYQPTDLESKVGLPKEKLPTSMSDSVLCHISVSRWAYTNGLPANGKERSERCARIAADVARRTAEIINAKMDGTYKNTMVFSKIQKTCTTPDCHGGNADKFKVPNLKGKMDCEPCHTGSAHMQNKLVNHP